MELHLIRTLRYFWRFSESNLMFAKRFPASVARERHVFSPTAAFNCSARVAGRRENAVWNAAPCTAAQEANWVLRNSLSFMWLTGSLS